MLLKFLAESRITEPYPFTFVPVGYNLRFEHKFLLERCRTNGLPTIGIIS